MTKFTCEAAALLKALRAVNELTIPAKEPLAIMKNVMVTINGSDAILGRGNFNGAVTKAMKVESEGEWSFTVEAEKLAKIVGTFENGAQVSVSVSDGWASVVCGRSSSRFGVLPVSTFPLVEFDEAVAEFTVGEDYIRDLALVAHAQSNDTTRYYLNGTQHRWHDGKLRLTASDGDRMAVIDTAGAEMPDAIVPTDAVALLLSLAPEADKITIAVSPSKMRWSFGDIVITHKLVDGTFPLTDRLIRTESPLNVVIDAVEVQRTIGRIMILADDKDRTCRWDISSDKLAIESRGLGDQGVDEIPCDVKGDPLSLAFRTGYLRDALVALNVDNVELGLFDDRAPMMVRAPAKPEALIVIMPTV